MILLDTDIITVLDRKSGDAFKRLVQRLNAVPDDERVGTTIISFEEQMRGWLAHIVAARKPEAVIAEYAENISPLSRIPMRQYNSLRAEISQASRLRNGPRMSTLARE